MSVRKDDIAWMRRALSLAKKAKGDTLHYPMVGAVVIKNNRVVGEGYFRRPGEPHAEVHALNRAGKKARGATLILNLEPCSHFGTTPPCADYVIKAGVKKVVAGMTDPNPLVAGKGFAKLKRAGVEVEKGVLEDECKELNRFFVKFITTRTPYVIVKAAATLDGKIATTSGDSCWISGPESRKIVHELRGQVQAVMVGANTVKEDDCRLTARSSKKRRHPRPVVVTSKLDIPLSCKVLKTPHPDGVLIFCTQKAGAKKVRAFENAGAEVVVVKQDRAGSVDLKAVMAELGKRKIASVLVEGGSQLHGALFRAGLVDELIMFVAPKMLAGDGISITSGAGPKKIRDAISLSGLTAKKVGDDIMLTAKTGPKKRGKKTA